MEYREKRVSYLNEKGEIVKVEYVKEPIYTTLYLRTFNMANSLLSKHSLDRILQNVKPLPLIFDQCREWCEKNGIELHEFDNLSEVLVEYGY